MHKYVMHKITDQQNCAQFGIQSITQIMDVFKQVDSGFVVPNICRELDISKATFERFCPL